MARNKVQLFGSGDEAGIRMADRIAGRLHDIYTSRRNYRGGKYTAGFWSMSQHVAYGFLSGAWPFGVVEAIWAVVALRRYLATPGRAAG